MTVLLIALVKRFVNSQMLFARAMIP